METTQSIAKVCRIDAIQKYSTTFDYFKRRCQICEYEQRGKKRVANVLLCLTHGIKPCGIPRPPRSEEKRKLLVNGTNDPVTDFSWMCDDSKGLTCMEKFHTFSLQQNLFKTRAINLKNAGTRVMFASIRMTSDIYRRRQAALGLPLGKRGRKKQRSSKGYGDDDSNNNGDDENGDEELLSESDDPYRNLPPQ